MRSGLIWSLTFLDNSNPGTIYSKDLIKKIILLHSPVKQLEAYFSTSGIKKNGYILVHKLFAHCNLLTRSWATLQWSFLQSSFTIMSQVEQLFHCPQNMKNHSKNRQNDVLIFVLSNFHQLFGDHMVIPSLIYTSSFPPVFKANCKTGCSMNKAFLWACFKTLNELLQIKLALASS